MSDPRRRSFVGLVGLTLLGQLTLLAYEVALTRSFGTTRDADAIALTFIVVFALANELVGWAGALFIPLFLQVELREGVTVAAGFLAGVLTAVMLVGALLWFGAFLTAPALVALLAPGAAADPVLLRWFSPLVVLLPAGAVLANALQARDRFALAALRPLLWYGTPLVGLLIAVHTLGAAVVPAGMTVGLLLHALLLGVAARGIARGATASGWKHVRRLASPLCPLVAMSTANYLQILVERALAGRLPAGSLSALTYAFRLVNAPITLLVVTAATTLFPVMSAEAVQQGTREAGVLVGRGLRTAIVLALPAAALLMACAEPIVRVLFERGAFTAESSRVTALALFYYAPALVGLTALQLLIRAYWALERIHRLAAIQVGVAAFGVAGMVGLTWTLGVRGLPIAVSLTSLVQSAALLAGLRGEVAGLAVAPIALLTVRIGAASGLAAVAAASVRALASEPVVEAALGVTAGAIIYVLLVNRLAPVAWQETLRLVGFRS